MTTKKRLANSDEFTLQTLKEKLEKLYLPQAKVKNVVLEIDNLGNCTNIPFPKKKMFQILGNIISNAIKFTPYSGKVSIVQDIKRIENDSFLIFKINDSVVGISDQKIESILDGTRKSLNGTDGEEGFGLSLLKTLLDGINGDMQISSQLGKDQSLF